MHYLLKVDIIWATQNFQIDIEKEISEGKETK